MRFFELLTSAPSLFANFSLAVDAAFNLLMIPPFFEDPTNLSFVDALDELSVDFVALANDLCDISLSENQTTDVDAFFSFVLPNFAIFSQECELLNVTIIEQAVDSADVGLIITFFILLDAITNEVGIDLLLLRRLNFGFGIISESIPDAAVPAAAQALLDDFLFFINDFCDIPPLSNTALTLLDEYFLVDLVNFATG